MHFKQLILNNSFIIKFHHGNFPKALKTIQNIWIYTSEICHS